MLTPKMSPAIQDLPQDEFIIEDQRKQLESDLNSTIIQCYKPKEQPGPSILDDASLIERFIHGETELISNPNLRIDYSFGRLQLSTRQSEIIGLLTCSEQARSVLIKAGSKYGELIHQILFKNNFVLLRKSSQKGFIEYRQYVPPAGYTVNCTQASVLWQNWRLSQRIGSENESINILIFIEEQWSRIKDILIRDEKIYLKINLQEITFHPTDKVVWSNQDKSKENTDSLPEQIPVKVVPMSKTKVSNPTSSQSMSVTNHQLIKDTNSQSMDRSTSKLVDPEERLLKSLRIKAIQTLANYLAYGEVEVTTEVVKNPQGEIINTKTVTVKRACPQWVIEQLLGDREHELTLNSSI